MTVSGGADQEALAIAVLGHTLPRRGDAANAVLPAWSSAVPSLPVRTHETLRKMVLDLENLDETVTRYPKTPLFRAPRASERGWRGAKATQGSLHYLMPEDFSRSRFTATRPASWASCGVGYVSSDISDQSGLSFLMMT